MIEIKSLSVSTTDGKKILDNFSLNLNAGEIHAIMGPNGTGKSTLSKILMGSEDYIVTRGDILVDNKSILNLINLLNEHQVVVSDTFPIKINPYEYTIEGEKLAEWKKKYKIDEELIKEINNM